MKYLIFFLILISFKSWGACPGTKPHYINKNLCQELEEGSADGVQLYFRRAQVFIKQDLAKTESKNWNSFELSRCDVRYIIQTCDKKILLQGFINEFLRFGPPERMDFLEEISQAKLTQYLDPNDKKLQDIFSGKDFFYRNEQNNESLKVSLLLMRGGYVPANFHEIQDDFYARLKEASLGPQFENDKVEFEKNFFLTSDQTNKIKEMLVRYFGNQDEDYSKELDVLAMKKILADYPHMKNQLIAVLKPSDLFKIQIISGIDLGVKDVNILSEIKKLFTLWGESSDKNWDTRWQKELDFYLNLIQNKKNADYVDLMKHLVELKNAKTKFPEKLFWDLFEKISKDDLSFYDKNELLVMLYSLNRVDWVKSVLDQLGELQSDVLSIANGNGWCVTNKSLSGGGTPPIDDKVVSFYQKYYQDYRQDRSIELLAKLKDLSQPFNVLKEEFKKDFDPKTKDANGENIFHYLLSNTKRPKAEMVELVKNVCKNFKSDCIEASGILEGNFFDFRKTYEPNTINLPIVKAVELGDVATFEIINDLREQTRQYYSSEGALLLFINSKNTKNKQLKEMINKSSHFSKTLNKDWY